MKKIIKKGFLLAIVFIFTLSIIPALACEESSCSSTGTQSSVSAIELSGSGDKIEWASVGTSVKGFKVVWSKNENPTYPCRKGDKYHYYSESTKNSDTLMAFSGNGTYYVRVCEYLGGACGKYSNQISVQLGSGNSGGESSEISVKVNSISITGSGAEIKWTVDGTSVKGFKVVWSKNENPTYPTRSSDRYHYYSDSSRRNDVLKAFDGSGEYYVRVCEYLGGACGTYSNQIKVQLTAENEGSSAEKVVKAITVSGEGSKIHWVTDGYSKNGFKVVWSKNENPTYPCREGDQYHYRNIPVNGEDFITPFGGNGEYYVRVCEYISGACGVYSNQIKVSLNNSEDKGVQQIKEIRDKAQNLANNNIDILLAEIKELKSLIKEQQVQINHLMKLRDGLSQTISSAFESAIKNFITYGVDDNTKKLGEGERAAVMYSFKAAFNKLPETEEELEDAIKIANGRWPGMFNNEAENEAKAQFKKIYLRDADMNNAHDAAAVKIMAYGLRQQAKNRNLKSEANALKTFKAIFKKMPQTTEEWNALQAITYSGSTR